MVRISLWLALFSCLLVCSLNFLKLKTRIVKLQVDLRQESENHRQSEKQLAITSAKLDVISKDLETAREENRKVMADALAQNKRAGQLSESLNVSRKEANQAKAELARFQAAGVEPEEIVILGSELKKLRVALGTAQREKARFEQQLKIAQRQVGSDVFLPGGLKTKVLLYDPKWQFVVLDTGREQGMVPDAELLVGRDGRFVAKVKISKVDQSQSIGNLVPGWQLGDITEGDLAIPANPGS